MTSETPLYPAIEKAKGWLGRTVEHEGISWRVAGIRAEHPDKPWAWLVNKKKPMDQCRLSFRAECFQ